MANMKVSCFKPGDKNTFTVDIETTWKVNYLKEKIKEKKPIMFTDVEADNLVLYQVTIEENLDKEPRMEKLERLYKEKEKESKKLDMSQVLRTYFDKSPRPGMKYYIIVEKPKGESTCWLTPSLWPH